MWGLSTIGEPVTGYTDRDFSAYIRQLFGQDDISAFFEKAHLEKTVYSSIYLDPVSYPSSHPLPFDV
jgi:hypothetical protein